MLSAASEIENELEPVAAMPTADEVIAALSWAGLTNVQAWRIVDKPDIALYKVIVRQASVIGPLLLGHLVASCFCEVVHIPCLYIRGGDVHLLLKLDGFANLAPETSV